MVRKYVYFASKSLNKFGGTKTKHTNRKRTIKSIGHTNPSKYNTLLSKVEKKIKTIDADANNYKSLIWYANCILSHSIEDFLIWKLHDIVCGNIDNNVMKIKLLLNILKNAVDGNKHTEIDEFLTKYIINGKINMGEYELKSLTNDKTLTPAVIRVIDIIGRYFPCILMDYNVSTIRVIDINNKTNIESYIRSRNKHIKFVEPSNQIKADYLIAITMMTASATATDIRNQIMHIVEGGNMILIMDIIYDNINWKTTIIKYLEEIAPSFGESIITRATLDIGAVVDNVIFIGKDKRLNIEMETEMKNTNEYIRTAINKLQSYSPSGFGFTKNVKERYTEIYRWFLRNNIPAINVFEDKPPRLIENANMRLINMLFPQQNIFDKRRLRIYDISIYSITQPAEASIISKTIKTLITTFIVKGKNMKHMENVKKLIITDGTANVGGNTLNFSDNFKIVNSIEYDKTIFEGLKHNCKLYRKKNIHFYNGDCNVIIPKLKQDAIFIDPPWNGLFYKAYDKLPLYLGKKNIYDIVYDWHMKEYAKIYCIKCPSNFDFQPFIATFKNIYIQSLKNWNVIYIW